MKQFLLPAAMMLLAGAAATAQQANVYASNVKASGTNEVTMVLNTDATNVIIEVLDAQGNVVGSEDLGAGKKGTNTFEIKETGVADGAYSYRVVCKADAVTEFKQISSDSDELLQIANTRGVSIDNNTASPYFGRIYATSIAANAKTGARLGTGLYILGADGSDVTAQEGNPYAGGESWSGNSGPMRPFVAEDGNVYVCDWTDGHSGVWVMDPATPEANWRPVFGGTRNGDGLASQDGVNIHGSVNGLFLTGKGEDLKMYTIDEDLNPYGDGYEHLVRYDLGTQTTPWVVAPSQTYDIFYLTKEDGEKAARLVNGNQGCRSDAHGGAWISQYRFQPDAYPCVSHINLTTGEYDYTSLVEQDGADPKEGIFKGTTPVGALGVSPDGKYVAVGNAAIINVAEATYDENGVPSLELKYESSLAVGARPFDIAFDVAGNLYVANNDNNSGIVIFALPKADNSFTTPANDTITLANQESGVGSVSIDSNVTPVYFDMMGRKVANPEAGKVYIEVRGANASKVVL